MIVGEIKGKSVEFGETENGYVYKNYIEFDKKSDKICYIPEFGLNDKNIIDKESYVFRYIDFFNMAKEYVKNNNLNNTYEDIARDIFDLVDWQHPKTLLDEWEMNLD